MKKLIAHFPLVILLSIISVGIAVGVYYQYSYPFHSYTPQYKEVPVYHETIAMRDMELTDYVSDFFDSVLNQYQAVCNLAEKISQSYDKTNIHNAAWLALFNEDCDSFKVQCHALENLTIVDDAADLKLLTIISMSCMYNSVEDLKNAIHTKSNIEQKAQVLRDTIKECENKPSNYMDRIYAKYSFLLNLVSYEVHSSSTDYWPNVNMTINNNEKVAIDKFEFVMIRNKSTQQYYETTYGATGYSWEKDIEPGTTIVDDIDVYFDEAKQYSVALKWYHTVDGRYVFCNPSQYTWVDWKP